MASEGHWTWHPTEAAGSAAAGLKVVDGIISFMSTTRGNPGDAQRALYIAAVAFSYAVWESYAEDLAVESVQRMLPEISPALLPVGVVNKITANESAWSLAVHPGWTALWKRKTEEKARGTDQGGFGLNTARPKQVRSLFEYVGIDPFDGVSVERLEELENLVTLRGEVVHTAKVPSSLRKRQVIAWRDFVRDLCSEVDAAARRQCNEALLRRRDFQ